jgi:TRAP-type C4-dicarboxylate transport system substrate-binding protein
LLLAGIAGQANAETVKLKFSTWEPPQSWGPKRIYEPWIRAVEKASGGTLKIDMYAGASLGKPVAQLQNIKNRVADIGILVPSFTPGRFKYNEIGELPLLWSDPTVAGIAATHLVRKGLLKYPDIKVVGVVMTAAYQLHANRPMTRLEDLKGLKIRAAGPIFGKIVRAIGATPVGIPTPSVALSISRGVLNGAMNDWTLAKTFRILDVTPHHYEVPLGGVIALIGMNKQSYASLPPKAKAAIDKYSGEYISRLWGDVVKSETKAVVSSIKTNSKHTIVYPSAAELKRWKARLRPIVDGWAATSPEHKKRLQAFEAALAAARAKVAK